MDDHNLIGGEYFTFERFSSYSVQVREILGLGPASVLEIGSQAGIVTRCLERCELNVTTADIDTFWKQDTVASVERLPFDTNAFDVVLCAEVLEHLPFEKALLAMREIGRVARSGAVITLPHYGRYYSMTLKLPRIYRLHLHLSLPYFFKNRHVYDGQQHWEIGKRGYPVKRMKRALKESGLLPAKDYRIPTNRYHHVFVVQTAPLER